MSGGWAGSGTGLALPERLAALPSRQPFSPDGERHKEFCFLPKTHGTFPACLTRCLHGAARRGARHRSLTQESFMLLAWDAAVGSDEEQSAPAYLCPAGAELLRDVLGVLGMLCPEAICPAVLHCTEQLQQRQPRGWCSLKGAHCLTTHSLAPAQSGAGFGAEGLVLATAWLEPLAPTWGLLPRALRKG